MKRIASIFIFLLFYFSVFAQGVIKEIETKNFPEVSFYIQYYNPVLQQESMFVVEEEGIIAEDIKVSGVENQTIPEKANVLLLWDFRGKEEFVPTLLKDLLKNVDVDNLFIDVALIRRDEEGSPLYEDLIGEFTDDRNLVIERMLAKQEELFSTKSKYLTKASDIIWALPIAIEQFDKCSKDEAKAILLLTDGRNNTNTGSETMPIVADAKEKRVPIYCVNIAGDEAGVTFTENLSKRTFGDFLKSDGSFTTYDERKKLTSNTYTFLFPENETISQWLKPLAQNWIGHTYLVSFKSQFERIGELKHIKVRIGSDSFEKDYLVPGFSLAAWIRTHVLLFIILLVVVFTGIGIGLFFLIRHIQDVAEYKKEDEEKEEAERKRFKTEQETLRRKLDLAESEQRRRLDEARKKEEKTKRQEYLSSINSLMRARNIKARVLISTMSGSFDYMIDSAETTIGTSEDNMIVIDDRTVSRHHAILYFNGEDFGIRDLKSTNGIVMNGFKMDDMKLRNGDSVSLGNTIIKIYF